MELKDMKFSELREVARSRGLKSWTALRKNDLREFLISNGVKKPTPASEDPSTNTLLNRFKKLEEENNELRQRQTSPALKPTPYKPPPPSAPIPKTRTKAKAAKNSWYDWLVSHVPEPIKNNVSIVKRQILSLYDNEPLPPFPPLPLSYHTYQDRD